MFEDDLRLPESLRSQAWTLMGGLYVAGGVFGLLSLVLGGWPGVRSTATVVALTLAAIVVGLALVAVGRRLPFDLRVLVASTAVGAMMITAAMWAGGPYMAPLFGAIYAFVAGFSAFYFPRWLALGNVVFCGMLYLGAVVLLGLPGGVGQVVGVLGIATVGSGLIGALGSQLRQSMEQERDDLARRRELDAMRAGFMQAVSHEIRTPLSAIYGNAQTLARLGDHVTPDTRRELTAGLLRQAERLEALARDVLDVERLTRGGRAIVTSRIDLSLFAAGVAARHLREGRPIQVDVDPAVVEVDVDKVERILDHLLVNAHKHTPAGADVVLTAEVVDRVLVLAVEDDGPGIPQHRLVDAFQPLHQGPEAADLASPGTGIGLALVASLAEALGGRVRAGRSLLLGGASVVVEVPLVDAVSLRPARRADGLPVPSQHG